MYVYLFRHPIGRLTSGDDPVASVRSLHGKPRFVGIRFYIRAFMYVHTYIHTYIHIYDTRRAK